MREATKRNLILGNEINKKIMKLHPMNYPEAKEIWEAMLSNNWTVSEVNMADDFYDFKNLDESEKSMYGKALAFLSNLDGIQFNNLADNINKYVTAPEISLCLSRQAFEEALHVHAYSTMIESMGYFPDEIYEMFLTDEILFKKNNYILKQSSILGKEFSIENFILAVVANIALEGIYFYTGFLSFYILERNGKMKESAKMIKFINRDEITHLHLFNYIYKSLKEDFPEYFYNREMFENSREILRSAAFLEMEWGKYITNDSIMGLDNISIENYVKYLTNLRSNDIYLGNIFEPVENPFPWVDLLSKTENRKVNFFEGKVDSYRVGTLEW